MGLDSQGKEISKMQKVHKILINLEIFQQGVILQ